MKKNFTSTVAGASILITAVGLIGKGLGLVREIVFANFFGLNTQFDLYLVGAVFPLTINTIILYLGQNYFIPNYNKEKLAAPEKIPQFINSTFWSFFGFGIFLTAILFYFSGPIINLYLHEATISEFNSTLNVFRIFLLTIPLNAAYSILAAYLQAEFEFKSPAVSQLILNIAVIFLVIFFSKRIGVFSIPYGYVAGTLFQLIFLISKAVNKIKLNLFSFIKDANTHSVINTSLIITILIEVISQIYLLSDRYFFNDVQKGGIASLNYAMNLYLLPVTIISVALSTAIFPGLSNSLSANSNEEVQNKLDNFFCVNLFIFIPITIILILYGNVLIRVLFQRGEFTSSATALTFEVLKYYAVSLVFYSSYAVINKLLYGANLLKILLVITISGCVLKIAANFYLVGGFQQNGRAASTTLSYLFFFLAGLAVAIFKLKVKVGYFVKEFTFDLFNGALSFLISTILVPRTLVPDSFARSLFKLIVFSAVYLLNSKMLNHNAVYLFENAFGRLNTVKFKKSRQRFS